METQMIRFHSFQPPILRGVETPADCETWLEEIEMLFEFLGFTDECRIKLVGNQLREVARSWWLVNREAIVQRGFMITWKLFKVEFYQRFVPLSYREDKSAEFANLRQGQLKIEEYLAHFFTVLQFGPQVARNDTAVADQFIKGLNPEIRTLQGHFAKSFRRSYGAEPSGCKDQETDPGQT
ncbi:uncharacterized protein [Primulina eburnea]|uniref:uncharacterized protein n=1 Tax=Primulina eburnea TaxID=1245227 RepID=UPI003C6C6965